MREYVTQGRKREGKKKERKKERMKEREGRKEKKGKGRLVGWTSPARPELARVGRRRWLKLQA